MKTKGKKSKTDLQTIRPPLAKPLKPKKKRKKPRLFIDEPEDVIPEVCLDQQKEPSTGPVKRTRESPKVPAIRRQGQSENVEHNYMIVPWGSQAEWNAVCVDFHSTNYSQVIARIGVWQRRVPALPVGVEATLFLLEAIVYDRKFLLRSSGDDKEGLYTEDQARSLYSLAIIRYLNHVSHLAAQSLGESSTRPTRELAAVVDTPEWIVSLRNEISHGSTAPSIEVLRIAGTFILQWLKQKYWKLPEETETVEGDILTIAGEEVDDAAIPSEIDEVLAAYTAARIYKLRNIFSISDENIVQRLKCSNRQVKTKTAIVALKKRVKTYLQHHPSVFCAVFSRAVIPDAEFYHSFGTILRKNKDESMDQDTYIFEKFYGLWLPVMKMLQGKGKLLSVLTNLCEVIINPANEKVWSVTARWIDKVLEIIEDSGKNYAKTLTTLLGMVIKHPNDTMLTFLDRLFRLTEPRIGPDGIHKLTLLMSIALDDVGESKKRRKQQFRQTLFSVDDIEGNCNSSTDDKTDTQTSDINASMKWELDQRGEDFWRNIPIGAIF